MRTFGSTANSKPLLQDLRSLLSGNISRIVLNLPGGASELFQPPLARDLDNINAQRLDDDDDLLSQPLDFCRDYNRGGCQWRDCIYNHLCSRPGCKGKHPEINHDILLSQRDAINA